MPLIPASFSLFTSCHKHVYSTNTYMYSAPAISPTTLYTPFGFPYTYNIFYVFLSSRNPDTFGASRTLQRRAFYPIYLITSFRVPRCRRQNYKTASCSAWHRIQFPTNLNMSLRLLRWLDKPKTFCSKRVCRAMLCSSTRIRWGPDLHPRSHRD